MSFTKTNQNIFRKTKNAYLDERFEEAEFQYRSILGTTPTHPETCNYLALLLHNNGERKVRYPF